MVGEPSLRGSGQGRREVTVPPGEQHLCFGVTEADVELEHLRAVLGQHEPRVERTPKVDAAAAQGVQRREDGTLHDLADGTGEYAPMPPVFGPVPPSPSRLKSRAGAIG